MLRKLFRYMVLLTVTLALGASLAAPAQAAETDDAERGSITVTLHTKDSFIPRDTLRLYLVAKPLETGGDAFFAPEPDFDFLEDRLFGMTSEELSDPDLAEELSDGISNRTAVTSFNFRRPAPKGKVSLKFENLEPGLYLVVQTGDIKGYEKIHPFLVTVPYKNHMDVDAEPKFEQEKPCPTEPEGKPHRPPHRPPLIQTGQLNWPVPVLAGGGILLFMLGWVLVFRKRKRNET